MFLGKENGLGKFAIFEPDEISPGSVDGIESPVNLRKAEIPFRGETGSRGFREIGDYFEAVLVALVKSLEELCGSVGGREQAGQIGPLAIVDGLHSDARCGISWFLINLST